jgi:hypothetical protein
MRRGSRIKGTAKTRLEKEMHMKTSIMLRTVDFRGDHAADALIVYDLLEGETVAALVSRLIGHNKYIDPEREIIELRIIKENT